MTVRASNRKLLGLAGVAVVALVASVLAPEVLAPSDAAAQGSGITVQFTPYPPAQPPIGADNIQQHVYDIFAWQAFSALNWPAIVPDSSNGFKRGFADPSQSFTSQADPELPVWQTFKAKREIFLGQGGKPDPWNSQIDYGDIAVGSGQPIPADTFPICSDAADPAAVRQALVDGLHAFSMNAKVNSEGLDEDVEVKGEAYYPASIRGNPSEPQLWKTSSGLPVLYEVKLNYDWFDYVVSNEFYDSTTKGNAAAAGQISLPPRSASYTPGQCSDSSEFPCLQGAIETKSAWVLASGSEDTSRYHTTDALYFRSDPQGGQTCADLGTFLMTGLHINQKTANQPFFIYATWGHVDNAQGNDEFRYQDSDTGQPQDGYGVGYITTTETAPDGGPVYGSTRIPSWTQEVNEAVWAQIRAANPESVWLNYQLVGTQFLPVDSDNPGSSNNNYPIGSTDPGNVGQSFYLANLTLETSWGLQNFQGQPPGITTIGPLLQYFPAQVNGETCQGPTTYSRACKNTFNELDKTAFDMGGCMGCHGIAQQLGYDFSFVLLRGSGDVETAPPPRADG